MRLKNLGRSHEQRQLFDHEIKNKIITAYFGPFINFGGAYVFFVGLLWYG